MSYHDHSQNSLRSPIENHMPPGGETSQTFEEVIARSTHHWMSAQGIDDVHQSLPVRLRPIGIPHFQAISPYVSQIPLRLSR